VHTALLPKNHTNKEPIAKAAIIVPTTRASATSPLLARSSRMIHVKKERRRNRNDSAGDGSGGVFREHYPGGEVKEGVDEKLPLKGHRQHDPLGSPRPPRADQHQEKKRYVVRCESLGGLRPEVPCDPGRKSGQLL
jgi:hypothetical protein